MFGLFKQRRRERLLAAPTPPGWTGWLAEGFPAWAGYSAEERARFLGMLVIFLDEKRIVGAAGLEPTEQMRVIVGACAVRLVMGLDIDYYDHLTEIVLYPFDELIDPRDGSRMLGVAHVHGVIALSWPTVLRGLRWAHDGRDTAAHEFAHLLDLEDGTMDGTPPLRAREDYRPWAHALRRHFEAATRGDELVRPYGATSPVEFFAVVTEEYFERPGRLRARAPDLFAQLDHFYAGRDGSPGDSQDG